MTPAELARIQRMERVSLVALASVLIFSFVAHGYALWSRPLERERAMADAAAAARTPPPVVRAASRTASSPIDANTAASNAEAADAAAANAAAANAAAANATTLSANASRLAEAASMAPVSPIASAWVGPVAGRYMVTHRNVSVIGGDGCNDVATALAWRQPSIETIEADGNGSTIRLLARGVSGILEPDGRFVTGPDSGSTDGVRWTFSMSGRFTADGFVASSSKTTDAIIAWHKSRSCAVVAELTGHRLAR